MLRGIDDSAEFVGGDPALDLANTVGRGGGALGACERLPDYDSLVRWAGTCGLIDAEEMDALDALSERLPARAASELAAVKRFRELAFRIFAAIAADDEVAGDDLDSLRDAWHDAVAHASLGKGGAGFRLEWAVDRCGLATPHLLLVAASVKLLTGACIGRLRMCAADNCSRLFLDVSKSGQRRWCSMAACGNAAKARRFYRAHR
jgi:predicted RNA-binding Zn ribbon-like protein